MRLDVQNGRLVVSQRHVVPESRTALPIGGLTARARRRVPLHARATQFAQMLHQPSREQLEVLLMGTGLEPMLSAQYGTQPARPRRIGRRPIPAETLLPVAAAYPRAVRAGSTQPIEQVAAGLKIKAASVRDFVHKARLRGLLTPAPSWGRPGGELTPQANALLKRLDRPKPQPSQRTCRQ